MIGVWTRFGEGPPPTDGEALVFVRWSGACAIDVALGAPGVELVVAVHRYGMLHEQHGGTGSPNYGDWWTSLPQPSARA